MGGRGRSFQIGFGIFVGWGAWVGGRAGGRVIAKTAFASMQGVFRKKNNQAERVSDASGYKYQDRNGQWRNDTVKDITGLALRAWCEHKGVEYV